MLPELRDEVTENHDEASARGDVTSAVTVVVATRNRRDAALATVARLRALVERPRLVVVDDGSVDGTATAVQAAFPDVAVVRPEGPRGVTTARNAGVAAADTPLVAFADDDSWWAEGALGTAVRHFREHPRLGLLAAAILVGEDQVLDPTCVEMARSPLGNEGLPGPGVLGFVACGAIVRRQAFLEAGGFPDDYVIGGEEEPLALAMAAAGWDLSFTDDVVAHHLPDTVARDVGGRTRRVTRNDLWTAWRWRRGLGAVRRTVQILAGARTRAQLGGIADALTGLPAAVCRRRPVPASVEQRRRLLDAPSPLSAEESPVTGRRAPAASWVTTVGRRRTARNDARILSHHRPPPRSDEDDRLAVVVITHNRVDELVSNLHRLLVLPERPRVVVVDNASQDGTAAAVLAAHPWVELLVLDANAGAVGRNVAVDLLPHRYIAFCDDDTWWDPGSLERAADTLDAHPDVAVVTARILVEPGGVEDPVVEDMRCSPLPQNPRLPGHPLVSVLAGASVVRRRAFVEVGGFEPLLGLGGEEELLSNDLLAAGWQLRYLPDLTVHHAPSPARDAHRRRADGLRNTLWCSWLRRPPTMAVWRSVEILRRAPHDRVTAVAVGEALRGLPWVFRERRRLPLHIEQQLCLLDHQQLNSRARRYVS